MQCLITIISKYSVRKAQEEISEIATAWHTHHFWFYAADTDVSVVNMMKKSLLGVSDKRFDVQGSAKSTIYIIMSHH